VLTTSTLISPRVAGPTSADQNFSDLCQKLYAGAVNGQQYASAWAALAALFRASSVHLLRDQAAPPLSRETSAVHVLDLRASHVVLPRVVLASEAEHVLFAIVRPVPCGVDAVIVLRKEEPFTEAERSWMELMLGHIRAAFELGEQLALRLPTVASAVQLARIVPRPCLLTDEEGRCIVQNDAFGRVLEATPGAIRGGRVVFDDPFLQDSWQQALQEARITSATQSLLATTSTAQEWMGHVVPFSCVSSPVHGVPRHLMFAMFERSAGTGVRTHPVAGSSPLTKAELEVLESVLLGQTAKVIASTRGCSVNTVRSQIATILGKTGHRSQKELIASFGLSDLHGLEALGTGVRR